MRLISKFYLVLLPLFAIILLSSIFININDFNKRIDEASSNYIDSNIEDALYFKNNVVFKQYFEYMEYDLKEEANINLENINKLFKKKLAINKNYGDNIQHIILLSKDKKMISVCEKSKAGFSLELKGVNLNKPIVSIVDTKKHTIITPILKDNNKAALEENIYGYLFIEKKLHIENIELLKKEILTQSIITNSLYLVVFILVLYLVSRTVSKPVNELTKQIETLDFEEYKNIEISTDIKELSFLNKTFVEMSKQIENKQKSIIELNSTLEEKVKERTRQLQSTFEDIKQYKQLFEQNQAVMLLVDPGDGKIIDVNVSAMKFYGYSYTELLKKSIQDINVLSSEEISEELKNAKEEKRNHFFFIHRLKDGTLRHVEVHSGPIKLRNRHLLYSIIHDITEQKEQEKIIQEKDRMLQQQAKIAAVGEMLGNISHQWRQPLNIITTHASALNVSLDFDEEIPADKIRVCTDDVLKQCNYLSRTIDDFRDFFMSDSETKNLYDLKTVFKKLEGLIQSSFENNFIKYSIDIEDNINVELNENVLIQAFINICNNAKDAMVESDIDTDLRYFFIEVKKRDKDALIILKDSGGGIKEGVKDKIFEPYFTTKHPSIGTGIGLYMTNQIITKHMKGTIEVNNTTYRFKEKSLRGAEFRITLPIV